MFILKGIGSIIVITSSNEGFDPCDVIYMYREGMSLGDFMTSDKAFLLKAQAMAANYRLL